MYPSAAAACALKQCRGQSRGVGSLREGVGTKHVGHRVLLMQAHAVLAATAADQRAAAVVFDAAADQQVAVVTLAVVAAAAAATHADTGFDLAAAVDTIVETLLVLCKHLLDGTYAEPRHSAAGQRHCQASEAASVGALWPAACTYHLLSQMLLVHTPLPVGAAQHVLVASATSAERDSGRDPGTLAADYGSSVWGLCSLQACPAAAAAVAATAAAAAATAAAAAGAATAAAAATAPVGVAATAAAESVAAEEAHWQPFEVLVSWIWPTALPLLLQVLCQAALS